MRDFETHLTPHTSHLTPHTSHLTPHTSHLTPHTSHLTGPAQPVIMRNRTASWHCHSTVTGHSFLASMLYGVLCCVLTLVFAADGDSSATGRGICQRAAAQQVLLSYLSSRQNRSLRHLSAQCFDDVYSVLMASELISRLAGDVGVIQVVMTSVWR
jgi:hypothetical protein